MNRWAYIVFVLLLLWVFSYLIVNILREDVRLDLSDKIAVVEIKGLITSGNGITLFGEQTASADFIVNTLKEAEKDKSVKGILLDINSHGGTVVASSVIAETVKKIKKPVVAYIGETGASGGYWVAAPADLIVADPMSITGSIGVTGSYLEFSELMEKYGVSYEKLTAGNYKEMGGPYQKLTKEEKEILQKKLQIIQEHFVGSVIENRKGLSKEAVNDLSTGVFYLGEEAYQLGLVDYLGDKELAVNLTKQLANAAGAKLVEYKEGRKLTDILEMVYTNAFYFVGRGIGYEIMSRSEEPVKINV